MTFAYFLVILSVVGLLVLLALARGHWFARPEQVPGVSDLQAIDVEAFRNLIDESEEAFLRENLPPRQFRRVHRERMLAAVEYVRGAFQNAGILVMIAEAARESNDQEVAAAALKLFDNAVRLRWYTAQVIPQLYLKVLLPGSSHAPRQLFDRYDALTRQAIVLGRLGSLVRA
jgi:hypothetical protein